MQISLLSLSCQLLSIPAGFPVCIDILEADYGLLRFFDALLMSDNAANADKVISLHDTEVRAS